MLIGNETHIILFAGMYVIIKRHTKLKMNLFTARAKCAPCAALHNVSKDFFEHCRRRSVWVKLKTCQFLRITSGNDIKVLWIKHFAVGNVRESHKLTYNNHCRGCHRSHLLTDNSCQTHLRGLKWSKTYQSRSCKPWQLFTSTRWGHFYQVEDGL